MRRTALGSVEASIAVIAAVAMGALTFPSYAEEWQAGWGQGYAEYSIDHGPGNQFSISCDEGASDKPGKSTSVSIQIAGKSPPPMSMANIVLDGDQIQLQIDKKGTSNLDCHVCYDNFRVMWGKLRTARTMLVQYANGQSAKFDLRGARKALPAKVCKTPWDAF